MILNTKPDGIISIHALREEGDMCLQGHSLLAKSFLSTPSARRATPVYSSNFTGEIFLSTPSARRATIRTAPAHRRHDISIHALREEGDDKIVAEPFDEW